VAKAIVDEFEVIDVDEQDGEASELAIGAGEGSLQPIGQQSTIRQASQRVMKRQLLQLPLEGLALGDVAASEDNPGYGRLIEKVVDDHLEVMPGTVRVEEAELSRHICARLIQGLVKKCLGCSPIVGMDEVQDRRAVQCVCRMAPHVLAGRAHVADLPLSV